MHALDRSTSAPHATRVSVVCPSRRHFQGALETTRVLGEPRLRGEYKKFTNNAGKSADFPGSDMDCGPVVEPKQRAQPQQGLSGLGAIGEEDEEDESDDEPEHLTAGEVPYSA